MNINSLRLKITIHPAREAQIALLLAKKITIPAKYSDFADVFLEELVNVLSKQTGVNKYAIKLKKGKQLPCGLIYSLRLVEFEILKTYIKINLANGFIRASKLPAGARILFIRKLNNSFCLYFDYQGLINLIIKNWYPLLLIGKSLDWLSQAK